MFEGSKNIGGIHMKFQVKQLLISFLLITIAVGSLSISSFVIMQKIKAADYQQLETVLKADYDNAIKNQVEAITLQLYAITDQVDAGMLTDQEGRLLAADIIRQAKYGETGYFWADDLEGNNVVLLGNKDVEGTNRDDLQDKKGTYLIKELRANALAGGDYLDYWFPKPGEEEPSLKRGYSMLFEPYGWVIGTGNYLTDIEGILAEKEVMSANAATRNRIAMMVVGIIVLLIGLGIATIFSFTITSPIKKITKELQRISQLKLQETQDLAVLGKRKDEIGIMAKSLSHVNQEFRNVISEILDFSAQLQNQSHDMSGIAAQTNDSTVSVVAAVEEFARGAASQADEASSSVLSLESLNEHILSNNNLADEVIASSDKVNEHQDQSRATFEEMIREFGSTLEAIRSLSENINQLSEHSSAINDIVTTIEGIAGQTNLLALNASIEAARAGEAGKGFAVVASEIRNLAEQTTDSTSEINNIINLVTASVDASKENMTVSNTSVETAYQKMNLVKETIETSRSLIAETNTKMAKVQSGFQSINAAKEVALSAIESISAVTEESAATAEEINATMEDQKNTVANLNEFAKEILNQTNHLSQLLSKFQVD